MTQRANSDLRPGQSTELLKELHILTRDGRINQDSRRKLKQVYHLYQFIEKLLLELPGDGRRSDAGGPWRRQVVPRASSCTTCSSRQRGSGHIYGIETRRRTGGAVARAGCAAGLRAHVVPEPERGRGGRRGGAAGADRHGDRAACLRHRDRRRDRLRPAQAGALHGAGAVLPGRSGGLPAPEQGAGAVAHAAGRAVAPSAAHARDGQPADQRAALPVPGGLRLPGDRDRAGRLGAQPEERTHPGAPHRPAQSAAPPSACAPCWPSSACRASSRCAIPAGT